jgi:hypothetical protein
MKHPIAFWVAIAATVAICLQNMGSMLVSGWAAIHGAGLAGIFALVPMAVGLAMLRAGYVYLERRNVRRMSLLFTLYALAIVVANELVLPATPLKTWRARAALEAVDARNIRDEAFLSARGKPIGIRVTFDVVFPRTTVASIGASALVPTNGDHPSALQFGRYKEDILPSPSEADGPYRVFEKGTVYKFTQIYLPNFVSYNQRTQELCLPNVTTSTFSKGDLLSALSKNRSVTYRSAIQLSNESSSRFVVAKEYSTSRSYDLEAMHQTAISDVSKQCDK